VIDEPSVLQNLHHRVDVFALPSKQDNAPQVKFEALIDGLPVIAFDRTGCAEYLENGVNGWVAPDGDYREYAKGIEHFRNLFVCGKLQELRQQIADKTKSKFSEENIVGQYLKIYGNCCNS
jgi:glycosyltransferase involved in cell wall biosynthesis